MDFFEKIGAWLSALPSEIYVLLISILPLIELRGAIPVGAALGLPFYTNFLISVFGNILPIPFILLFIPKILDFLGKFKVFRPVVNWLREKAHKNSHKVFKKKNVDDDGGSTLLDSCHEQNTVSSDTTCLADNLTGSRLPNDIMSKGIFIGLMLFVALPLPGTGAWTGALVAALFDLPKKFSALAIFLGVIVCGIIMCLASYGVLGFLRFLL